MIRVLRSKIAIATCVASALLFAPATAQQGTGQIPNATNQGSYGPPLQAVNGHISFGGGAQPAFNAACGTGASIVGTDSAYTLNSGTSSSSTCTVTPAIPWNKRPTCSIDANVATQPATTVQANGTLLLTGVADSTIYNVLCIGQPGG